MSLTRFQKLALGLAGVTASGIGAFILIAPHAFYASYGISLGTDPSLLSELRAPAAGLLALGALMLAGLLRPAWTQSAVIAALIVFFAFPAGRVIGLIVDGLPSGSVLGALIAEVVIAGMLFAAFGRRRGNALTSGNDTRIAG